MVPLDDDSALSAVGMLDHRHIMFGDEDVEEELVSPTHAKHLDPVA